MAKYCAKYRTKYCVLIFVINIFWVDRPLQWKLPFTSNYIIPVHMNETILKLAQLSDPRVHSKEWRNHVQKQKWHEHHLLTLATLLSPKMAGIKIREKLSKLKKNVKMILIFSLNCVFAIIAQNESNFMKNIISSKVISSFLFPAYYFDFKTRMENHCLLWRRVDIMQKFWDWF